MAGLINRLPHLLREVSAVGSSWSIPLSLTPSAGTGTQHQAGAGIGIGLSIVDKPASGVAALRGSGLAISLASLSAGVAAGQGAVYCWRGLTTRIHDYLAAPISKRFVATTEAGMTSWRDASGWHHAYRPNPVLLDGADVVLPGGYFSPLTGALRSDLIAAGLDAYITLQEVRR